MDLNTALAFVVAAVIGGLIVIMLNNMMHRANSDELDRRGIYPLDDPRYTGRRK